MDGIANRVPAHDRLAGEFVVRELGGDGVRVARVSGILQRSGRAADGSTSQVKLSSGDDAGAGVPGEEIGDVD
jgi:hypothetical protein